MNEQISSPDRAPESVKQPDFNSEEFIAVYEAMWEPMTRQCIPTAVNMVGELGEKEVLDVAAGPGSLSELVARSGGHVVATDSSAAMVARAARRLEPYPGNGARVVEGQALDFDDASFDVTFSLFGVLNFPDWRAGMRELARVTRPGGRGCVSTWRDTSANWPFPIVLPAWRELEGEEPLMPQAEGAAATRTPDLLAAALTEAGFDDVRTAQVDVVWKSPTIEDTVTHCENAIRHVPPLAHLAAVPAERLRAAIRRATGPYVSDDGVTVPTIAIVAAGRKR